MDAGGRALKEDTGFLLETIAEVLLQPSFPQDELEKLRAQIRTGLKEAENDTGSVADRAFRETLYPEGHPYHLRTAGYLHTIDNITADDMRAFYGRYFRPDRATLFVVGDVEVEDIVSRANELFGSWKAGTDVVEAYEIPEVEQPGAAVEVFRFVSGKSQNDIVLGFPSVRRTDSDYYAFDLMNLLLGRIGLMGRLGKNVRDDQGLAYHAGSSFEAGLGRGPWTVRAGVNPMNVTKAIDSIKFEIDRIRTEPIGQEELEGGKRFMTGVMPLRLETSEGLLRAISEMELFGLGYDYISKYPQIVNALTSEYLNEVAALRLSSEKYVVSIAGPEVQDAPAEARVQ
jgi:zinc protease